MFLKCKVIKIFDGDSVTIVFPFGGNFWKKQCRLSGIDTPEIRSKSKFEKNAAYLAKEYVSNILLNKIIWIHFEDWDKYGRLLGTFYLDQDKKINVCQQIIDQGHAYKYNGGKKKKFEEWYQLK